MDRTARRSRSARVPTSQRSSKSKSRRRPSRSAAARSARPRSSAQARFPRQTNRASELDCLARLKAYPSGAPASQDPRSAWSPRRIPTCFANLCRSSFSLLSSRNSMSPSDGQLRKSSVIRSSRSSLACQARCRRALKGFCGRFSISWDTGSQRPHSPAPCGIWRAACRVAPTTSGSSRTSYV